MSATTEQRRRFVALLNAVVAQGWAARRTERGHWRLQAPTGAVVHVAASGDRRAFLNSKSLLRRYGAKV